jgi:hypothetical protein
MQTYTNTSSIFDVLEAKEEVETPIPVANNEGKSPCACKRKAHLEEMATKLSIIVSIIAIIYFVMMIFSKLNK